MAAGLWIPIFGWQLNPMFGAAAMSLSSFCVVTNALRLNMQNIYSTKRDKPGRKPKRQVNAGVKNLVGKQKEIIKDKEEEVMQKTMKIEGML